MNQRDYTAWTGVIPLSKCKADQKKKKEEEEAMHTLYLLYIIYLFINVNIKRGQEVVMA